ncbi:MAG: triose-phosphate isomerase [Candidatus Paceibacterota bacterium]
MSTGRKIIIGNWKMNPLTTREAKKEFFAIKKIASGINKAKVVICPPFIFLENLAKNSKSENFSIGAQDLYWEESGSFTGEISPRMLYYLGIKYSIVGHSEKRAFGETNEMTNLKIKACLKNKIIPILCVGERERDENHEYLTFIKKEIEEGLKGFSKNMFSKLIIAYEPIWAIGKNAKRQAIPEEFLEMSIFIRRVLSDMFGVKNISSLRIVYGGSVNHKNAKDFLENGGADGLLVGRDSLDSKKFGEILKSVK